MTLGNMRQNDVRSIAVYCLVCHHEAVLNADRWPDDLPMTLFDARMVCTRCGIIGTDVRPNWKERPDRPSLTGGQWH
jgi:hypothetical protein